MLSVLALFHDVTSADYQLLNNGSLLDYLWVGAKHMLTGYDHLLFILGVLFYLNHFSDILKFITAFTIGHSITLLTATVFEIRINEYLIDAVIGFSVLYKGFENLGYFERLFKISSPNLILMVVLFGLIHGLGLSARLQGFNLGSEGVVQKIIAFNIGVELGQVVALFPIVLILSYFRKQEFYPAFFKAVNTYLLIAGLALIAYQLSLQW
jgi:hypothetical protein